MQFHDPLTFVPGDEWEITGTLLDVGGGPLDLTAATLEWIMVGPDGEKVADQNTSGVTVQRGSPATAGKPIVFVGRGVTIPLRPGKYFDAMRVTVGGAPATMWEGTIKVQENCFHQFDQGV